MSSSKHILTRNEIQARAKKFSEKYKSVTYERGEAQTFYNDFFAVFGLQRFGTAVFERYVKKIGDGHHGFIDLFWPKMILAEHKSAGKSLSEAKQQAEDYLLDLKNYERPRCVLACDFQNFILIDQDKNEEYEFTLDQLHEKTELFDFMRGIQKHDFSAEDPVNIEASEIMGKIYTELKENGYPDDEMGYFLTRLTFCLFADDTGIFEPRGILHNYLLETNEDGSDLGLKIRDLFEILDIKEDERQKNTPKPLSDFPYINGNLFKGTHKTTRFNEKMRNEILQASKFDWAGVSPAIFGSLFQSIMTKKQRRSTGAHYTTEENIMKIIRPLFLDDLTEEFTNIKKKKIGRKPLFEAFQNKLSKLTFFDPACGAGNFLIIAYRELRLLEMQVIEELYDLDDQMINIAGLAKTNVDQFYGIELNSFSASIAEVALWMIDHLMNKELSSKFGVYYSRIPIEKSPTIKNLDSLEVNWSEILPSSQCNYILGNPPFGGSKRISEIQRSQIKSIAKMEKGIGNLDYVTCWFIKAARYMNSKTKVGFVSTNSISQGEQVGQFWPIVYNEGIDIIFAHESFKWGSEAKGTAQVTVVIIGFSKKNIASNITKRLFYYENGIPFEDNPKYISPYIMSTATPNLIVMKSAKPLNGLRPIRDGAVPLDGGNLTFEDNSVDDFKNTVKFLEKEPQAKQWLRPLIDADDFISGRRRWVLYLKDADLSDLKKNYPETMKHVLATRDYRLSCTRKATQLLASKPTEFAWGVVPNDTFLLIPRVTSENRKYIPIGYLDPPILTSNRSMVLENADLSLFGLLTSKMHMIWLDKIGGKLETRYSYSSGMVYNTFPVPRSMQKDDLKLLSQNILDIRFKSSKTLEKLYDGDTMPPDLVKAHEQLDRAVERLYRKKPFESDHERFEFLLGAYQKIKPE